MNERTTFMVTERCERQMGVRRRLALVADDEPTVLRAVVARLRAAGWEVLCAQNGLEVVEIVRERAHARLPMPELVITDVNMPWLAGPEALAAVSTHLEQATLFVMTAHVSPDIERRVRPLGARLYAKVDLMHKLGDILQENCLQVAA